MNFLPENPASLMKTLEARPPCWYSDKTTGVVTLATVFAVVESAAEFPFLNKTLWKENLSFSLKRSL